MLLFINVKNPSFVITNINITVYLVCTSLFSGQLTGYREMFNMNLSMTEPLSNVLTSNKLEDYMTAILTIGNYYNIMLFV